MKKAILLLMIFVFIKAEAQNYQISFTASGASTTVDSVKVENLTQDTSITVKGSDILNLILPVGINNINMHVTPCTIYPNPMAGFCMIEFDAKASGQANIMLYDIVGKRLAQLNKSLVKGKHSFSLNGLGSGIYTLAVKSDNYSYTTKLISINTSNGIAKIKHINTTPVEDNNNMTLQKTNTKSLKSNKSVIDMAYSTGDRLKLTGYSGVFRTINTIVPDIDQTISFNFINCTDADSNRYAIVQIGGQVWMAENLNVGTMIINTDNSTNNAVIEKYCYGNSDSLCRIYGALYQWEETMQYDTTAGSRGICPAGWHIPTYNDWTILADTLGGWGIAGSKMKETGTAHWAASDPSFTNESGFSALGAGYRNFWDTNFYDLLDYSYYWTASRATYMVLYKNGGDLAPFNHNQNDATSIRCIKDN